MRKFEVTGDAFVIDGRPVRLISGAMHYFRVAPEYWLDRLSKLKACGLNAVETYVPWNAHEPSPGQFRFKGMLDLERYIELAASLDLLVIVRPGPYICAEWDLGGLPAWLLQDPGMRLRCAYGPYLDAVARYFDVLMPRLAPLQWSRGGPVVAMQIENEYGSYGVDKEYLAFIERAMRERGIDAPLFTSDGPEDGMLQGGTLPHLLKTVNFGGQPASAFRKLRQYQHDGPLMCMEFWNGWFDHWGEKHHTRDAADAAACLDDILATGASVNLYMFHGGTNFGLTSGANFDETFAPTVTSYDYDAPLDETGEPTEKYYAFRNVIGKYRPLPPMPARRLSSRAEYGEVRLTEQAGLFDHLDVVGARHRRVCTEPMEMLGQSSGLILYRTKVSGPRPKTPLALQEVRDRAQIYVDGELRGAIHRSETNPAAIEIDVPAAGAVLDVLVENMGHVNYGHRLGERKGITEGVRLGNQFQQGWDIYTMPMDKLDGLVYHAVSPTELPAFYRGTLEIESPADTFISLQHLEKGICYVNGFCLGRYWNREPFRNLYVPGPLLKRGLNEFVVFELHGVGVHELFIELVDTPDVAPLRERKLPDAPIPG